MELIFDNLWLAWIVVSIVCLIIELNSGDLYFICFAIGALVSMIFDLCGAPLWMQVLFWALSSMLCVFFVRPSLMARLHGKKERRSNADALIGATGVVSVEVPSSGYGYVRIAGDEWRSISATGETIPKGTTVTVVNRQSTILTVKIN
ncbi:MAG: NfeD family protein [Prevotella sp.]|nr:NfeD family protein [Prevotella sp.]MBR4521597.1 NfeD family protein [Prevotella sp.]